MTDTFPTIEEELRRGPDGPTAPPTPPDIAAPAADAGLLDVAYATEDSPVGRLLLAVTPQGLVRLAYLDGEEDEEVVLQALAVRVSPRILTATRRLDEPRRELEQYFAGRRRRFDYPIDWQLVRGFGRRILEVTAAIPFGSVTTYGKVAAEAGSPRGARAAGNALGRARWLHGRTGSQATAAGYRGAGLAAEGRRPEPVREHSCRHIRQKRTLRPSAVTLLRGRDLKEPRTGRRRWPGSSAHTSAATQSPIQRCSSRSGAVPTPPPRSRRPTR